MTVCYAYRFTAINIKFQSKELAHVKVEIKFVILNSMIYGEVVILFKNSIQIMKYWTANDSNFVASSERFVCN